MRRDGGLAVPQTKNVNTLGRIIADACQFATSPGRCGGTAIVHSSRQFTCSEPECVDEALKRSPLDSHDLFVPCTDVLGSDCPVCDSSPLVSDAETDL
jgi:hypothetical protein